MGAQALGTALARAAYLVRRLLAPWPVTWEPPLLTTDFAQRAVLTRLLDGVFDVRTKVTAETGREPSSTITSAELRRLLDLTDAVPRHLQNWHPAPAPGIGAGTILYEPSEIADMLEAEAQVYLQAGNLLIGTVEQQGQGAHLRRLATGLTQSAWRVRRLPRGDEAAAAALVDRLQRECRAAARREAHGLWESDTTPLKSIAAAVQHYLLPGRIDPTWGATSGVRPEYDLHRRWLDGVPDVREVVLAEQHPG